MKCRFVLLAISWNVLWGILSMCEAQESKLEDLYRAGTYTEAGGQLPYRLLAPSETVAGREYPLVIFLHGAGERGTDNKKQFTHGLRELADASLRQRYPAFVVAPQCPVQDSWVDVAWNSVSHQMDAEPTAPVRLTRSLLDHLVATYPVDTNRIYIVGLSMGGYGTFDFLQRYPARPAAAIAVCGGGDVERAGTIKHVPLWIAHGEADDVVPPTRSRSMVEAIRGAGGRPIYTEYPGVGHDSWTQTFGNRLVWDWLFAQVRSAPAP